MVNKLNALARITPYLGHYQIRNKTYLQLLFQGMTELLSSYINILFIMFKPSRKKSSITSAKVV